MKKSCQLGEAEQWFKANLGGAFVVLGERNLQSSCEKMVLHK